LHGNVKKGGFGISGKFGNISLILGKVIGSFNHNLTFSLYPGKGFKADNVGTSGILMVGSDVKLEVGKFKEGTCGNDGIPGVFGINWVTLSTNSCLLGNCGDGTDGIGGIGNLSRDNNGKVVQSICAFSYFKPATFLAGSVLFILDTVLFIDPFALFDIPDKGFDGSDGGDGSEIDICIYINY